MLTWEIYVYVLGRSGYYDTVVLSTVQASTRDEAIRKAAGERGVSFGAHDVLFAREVQRVR